MLALATGLVIGGLGGTIFGAWQSGAVHRIADAIEHLGDQIGEGVFHLRTIASPPTAAVVNKTAVPVSPATPKK